LKHSLHDEIIIKMSTGAQITFNESEITAWVQACQHEGTLREEGASAEEIIAARVGVIAGLVSLIAPSMPDADMAPLFALLLSGEMNSVEVAEVVDEDPIPESILDTDTASSSDSEPDTAND